MLLSINKLLSHLSWLLIFYLAQIPIFGGSTSSFCQAVQSKCLVKQRKHEFYILYIFLQGNNESAIEQLSYYKRTGTGFVSFEEAYACANNPHIHSTLKSHYVELILVMFVAVGNNRSYLDHLCYSFVSLHKS